MASEVGRTTHRGASFFAPLRRSRWGSNPVPKAPPSFEGDLPIPLRQQFKVMSDQVAEEEEEEWGGVQGLV